MQSRTLDEYRSPSPPLAAHKSDGVESHATSVASRWSDPWYCAVHIPKLASRYQNLDRLKEGGLTPLDSRRFIGPRSGDLHHASETLVRGMLTDWLPLSAAAASGGLTHQDDIIVVHTVSLA